VNSASGKASSDTLMVTLCHNTLFAHPEAL
jgi:hypothetical protein